MEEEKAVLNKELYEFLIPRIAYYLKSNNLARIFKKKCPLFGAGAGERRIKLFSNSLEHMGDFSGHDMRISCLCAISNKGLASGSWDKTIKIWNIEDRAIMSTLYGHTGTVNALCKVKEGVFVSGSYDKSLIIWSKTPPESSIYSQRGTLTGHTRYIKGLARVNNRQIVSGDHQGFIMFWDIDQGLCLRQIPLVVTHDDFLLNHIKYDMRRDIVIVSHWNKVSVWGADNTHIQKFDTKGESIEFLSEDLLLRGGDEGQLEFIDYSQTGCKLYPTIEGLHSDSICAIQRIAKNIVITVSDDGYLKVIDPISRQLYLRFKSNEGGFVALAYFY